MIASPFRHVSRAWSGLLRSHRAGRTMSALGRLDDRTLRDIGIDRSEILGIALEIASHPRPAGRREA